MSRSRVQVSFLAILVLFIAPSVLRGQTERGAIVGLVTDTTGAVVQNATVTVTNVATKTSQTFTTNEDGLYEAPFLTPATYEVSATAQGFGKTVNNGVVVNVGQRTNVNLELTV